MIFADTDILSALAKPVTFLSRTVQFREHRSLDSALSFQDRR